MTDFWINTFTILVIALFSSFVFLDVLSIFPRASGSIVKLNGISYSFQVIVNTFKRIFIVSYPPLIGLIIIYGDLADLIKTVFLSCLFAIIPLFLCIFLRRKILKYFCYFLVSYNKTGWLLRSAILVGRKDNSVEEINFFDKILDEKFISLKSKNINLPILFLASWIYLFYGSSMFVINLIAYRFADFSSVVLQLTGLINALGTFVMAFFLDPKLSRIFEHGVSLSSTINSLLLAHILNICLLTPIFITTVIVVLFGF